MRRDKKWLNLAFLLLLCFGIAWAGSFATQTTVGSWYVRLDKPFWNPPAWVFPPVWTILYGLIAVSGWFLLREKKSKERTRAVAWYALQLFFNAVWSFLFFYFKNPFLGLLDILLLAFAIGMTLYSSWKVSKIASYLLFPYFLWVLYAATLNAAILAKNF